MADRIHTSTTAPATDPALETGPDGRSLLQVRLALYGKTLTVLCAMYWAGFIAMWSQEPTVGPRVAVEHLVSVPNLVVFGAYASLWLRCRGAIRSATELRAYDLGVHAAVALLVVEGWLIAPATPLATFEVLVALMFKLSIRSVIVPSSRRHTALVGTLVSTPVVIAIAVLPPDSTAALVQRATMVAVAATWLALATAFSVVASGILYGLRRDARDARRLGQYTLLEPLGKGGMGEVYRARHAMLRRPTAIKLVPITGGAQSRDRFEREVQHMASLAHPNIVTVYDYGRTADGTMYYAMELLDGADLERIVRIDGPQLPARVIRILIQVCRALADAHAAGLVHRDIKPANLFLCGQPGTADIVKVLDFGLVKDLDGGADVALTRDGAIMGTPLYMAPEAWTRPDAVDARSDIYSLGAVAYFLLTGHPVFAGGSPFEVMLHHTQAVPPPPSQRSDQSIPSDLEAVVMRCMAKDPDERFASADLLRTHLEDCELARTWTAMDARDWWTLRELRFRRAADPMDVFRETQIRIDAQTRRRDAVNACSPVPGAAL